MSRYAGLATVSLTGGLISLLFPIFAFVGSVVVVISSCTSIILAVHATFFQTVASATTDEELTNLQYK
jgi:hypothetical protein